jgi:hypothetical protein
MMDWDAVVLIAIFGAWVIAGLFFPINGPPKP